ncbi:Hypothetical predicted protein [Cloeon dipterum]|uniref:Uncharacterized protein n=1 Tax=Cloeon dipterum TaxID=197152 RepID=A0A8S1CTH6_9INSE|nr:Hypothetical predicted protein [Cloeon dipterum]
MLYEDYEAMRIAQVQSGKYCLLNIVTSLCSCYFCITTCCASPGKARDCFLKTQRNRRNHGFPAATERCCEFAL